MSKRRTLPFAENLEQLASQLVTELLSARPGMSLGQRIDAFKALTSYWGVAERVEAKKPQEDEDDISFAKWQDKLTLPENGPVKEGDA